MREHADSVPVVEDFTQSREGAKRLGGLASLRECLPPYPPKQYNFPSCDPITIRPPATAGDADNGAPALNSHTFAPLATSST
jgi:hypothetical protein